MIDRWGILGCLSTKATLYSGETMKIIVFLAVMAATSCAFAADIKHIAVHGHRGSRGTMPENTIPAFEAALIAGVDVLELDLVVTKDNVLVVSHDPKVKPGRCLDAEGKKIKVAVPIIELTIAELKKYDCGSLLNPSFPKQVAVPGTPMPTLDQVFTMVEKSGQELARRVEFNIETKIFPSEPELTPSPTEFAKLVAESVQRRGMVQRVIVQSFDIRTLKEIKKIAPDIRISQLTSSNLLNIVPSLKAADVDIWSPNYRWITPETVKEAHAAGFKVVPWTINTEKEWGIAIKNGADAIITDYPTALIEYLKTKKLR